MAYYRNCTASIQTKSLHSDKDQQILIVGGPNTRKTNPRWRTAQQSSQTSSSAVADEPARRAASRQTAKI